jgi:hypothetical protein
MASKGHLCSRTCIDYSGRIPLVVRPNERNVLDQRQLEYELVEKYILLCLLRDPNTNLIGWTRNPRYHFPIRSARRISFISRRRVGVSLPLCVSSRSCFLFIPERVLAPTERPAAVVIRRLQQAGYDQADSLTFLGAEDMTFLMKLVYKSQLLGPTVGRPPKIIVVI